MDVVDHNDELRDMLLEIQERVGTIYHFGVLPLYCTDEWVCGCFEHESDYPEVAGDTPMEAARKLLEQVSGDSADYLKPEEEVAAMDADLADLIERGREAAALDHTCMTADRMMRACDAKQSALRDLLAYVEAGDARTPLPKKKLAYLEKTVAALDDAWQKVFPQDRAPVHEEMAGVVNAATAFLDAWEDALPYLRADEECRTREEWWQDLREAIEQACTKLAAHYTDAAERSRPDPSEMSAEECEAELEAAEGYAVGYNAALGGSLVIVVSSSREVVFCENHFDYIDAVRAAVRALREHEEAEDDE